MGLPAGAALNYFMLSSQPSFPTFSPHSNNPALFFNPLYSYINVVPLDVAMQCKKTHELCAQNYEPNFVVPPIRMGSL